MGTKKNIFISNSCEIIHKTLFHFNLFLENEGFDVTASFLRGIMRTKYENARFTDNLMDDNIAQSRI